MKITGSGIPNPTYTILLLGILTRAMMCFNLPLKIVPNTYTMYPGLSKSYSAQLFFRNFVLELKVCIRAADRLMKSESTERQLNGDFSLFHVIC